MITRLTAAWCRSISLACDVVYAMAGLTGAGGAPPAPVCSMAEIRMACRWILPTGALTLFVPADLTGWTAISHARPSGLQSAARPAGNSSVVSRPGWLRFFLVPTTWCRNNFLDGCSSFLRAYLLLCNGGSAAPGTACAPLTSSVPGCLERAGGAINFFFWEGEGAVRSGLSFRAGRCAPSPRFVPTGTARRLRCVSRYLFISAAKRGGLGLAFDIAPPATPWRGRDALAECVMRWCTTSVPACRLCRVSGLCRARRASHRSPLAVRA